VHTVVSVPTAISGGSGPRSLAILSTFPPTSCGIATFSAALAAGLIEDGASVNVVRCGAPPPLEDPLVVASISGEAGASIAPALEVLNAADVAVVQHEYGLFDGPDGDSVLAIMERITVPLVVVAHTVVSSPTPGQRSVLDGVCRAADMIVVMTETARERLLAAYTVDPARVTVIAHGAATPGVDPESVVRRSSVSDRPRLLTWGLLGPGKGIEWAIDAMDELVGVRHPPEYVIAGATHPKVRAHSGEAYRQMLIDRAARSTSGVVVSFDDRYRDLESLTGLIRSADVVVLPYDSRDQVTSGVLVDAVAAGRPVVSTAFPHAVELLASGAGIVVPQRDPVALGRAIRSVLADPDLAASMAAEAQRLAPSLSWAAVAHQYVELGNGLVAERAVMSS
jgi:polysaccharide biosynthesis protein PslF